MNYSKKTIAEIAEFKTGKLNSNCATPNGKYPFFTCSPEIMRIDDYAYDEEAILLAGNNASGNFNVKLYKGKFNAYQRTYIITAKNNCSLEFLYYSLQLALADFKLLSKGTATKFITADILSKFEINFFPLSIQKKIANKLIFLDKKINKNNEQITVLERINHSIYQSWFCDFKYPGAIDELQSGIPVGWTNSNVFDNIIEIREKNKDNLDYPVLSVVKEGEFRPSDDVFTKQVYSKETTNYRIVRRNQIAYNPARANIGSIAMLSNFDAGLVSPIYVVFKTKETITPTFFYYYMKQPTFLESIKHHAIGTTRQNFPFEAFKMFPMVIPPIDLQRKFEDVAKPIKQKIAKLKEENIVLAEIRDTLLPKLMSGELPVEAGEN